MDYSGTAEAVASSSASGLLSTITIPVLIAIILFFIYRRYIVKTDSIVQPVGERSKIITALLSFFLGIMGVHRYYLGYKKQGFVQTCGFVSLIIGWVYNIGLVMNNTTQFLIIPIFLMLFGAATGIWAFVDFIRILTGSLLPVDGSTYSENRPAQVQVVQSAPSASDSADALEKLAKLHQQGILSDDEFDAKKKDILAKM